MRSSYSIAPDGLAVLHQYFNGVNDAVEYAESASMAQLPTNNRLIYQRNVGGYFPNGLFKATKKAKGVQIHFSAQTWLGVSNTDAVDDAIRHGWPEGVEKIQAALNQITETPRPESVRRHRVSGSFGDSVDMQRVWSGSFDNAFSRMQRSPSRAPQNVTIYVPLGASWNVLSDELFWRGAACLKLADILTNAGFNVCIVGYRSTAKAFKDGTWLYQEVTIKEHSAPLDMDALASSLSMAGFFRYLLFRCHANTSKNCHERMGFTAEVESLGINHNTPFTEPHYVEDSLTAAEWIKQQLRLLNNQEH